MAKVRIKIYKWGGSFGPFSIKSTCGECGLTVRIIKDVAEEFGNDVSVEEVPWLDNWYKAILVGGWHAPIVVVNDKVLSQGIVVDRDTLRGVMIKELCKGYEIPKDKNFVFTLPDCKYCKESKGILRKAGISFEELDVLHDNVNMQRLLSIVLGKVHPIALPQIFIKGKWIGGAEELKKMSSKELKKLDA